MDQLKKVLEYRFWILLAVACITPIVGWYMGHTAMAAVYETRKTALDGAYSGIPKGTNPNQSWSDQAKVLNQQQEALFLKTWHEVYDEQQTAKVWPDGVPADLDTATPAQLGVYPQKHRKERERVYALIRPFDRMTKKGVVEFDFELVPNVVWPRQGTPPDLIREAQEDLWLAAALFQGIDRVNAGHETNFDAPIRGLLDFQLLGGGGPKKGGVTGSGPTQSTGPAASPDASMHVGTPAGAESDMGANSFGGGSKVKTGADYEPAEVLGAQQEETASAATGAVAVQKKFVRHVEKTDYYKTRGFHMKLLMDHNSLPKLLVELSNGPDPETPAAWPVKILRVQQFDVVQSELQEVQHDPSGAVIGAVGSNNSSAADGMHGSGTPSGSSGGFRSQFRRSSTPRTPMQATTPMPGAENADPGTSPANEGAGTSDGTLAYVTLTGVITIYEKPPEATPPGTGTAEAAPLAQAPQAVPPTTEAAPATTAADPAPADATATPPDTAPATATEAPATNTPPAAESTPAATPAPPVPADPNAAPPAAPATPDAKPPAPSN